MIHRHHTVPAAAVAVEEEAFEEVIPPTAQERDGSSLPAAAAEAHTEDDDADAVMSMDIDDAIESLGMGPFQNRVLLAAGLCFAADSMEVLLLTFLAVVLQVEWDLSDAETATMVSSVFVGALFGTLTLGMAGDIYGRKPVFLVTAGMISILGILTAAANSYVTLLLTRAMVGFGVGGLTVPFDVLAEFIPTSHRGTNLLAIEYFWTAGSLLVPLLAFLSFRGSNNNDNSTQDEANNDRDWRVFVVLCSIPCFISTILGFLYVPESPRWLLSQGRHQEALQVLRRASAQNGHNPDETFPLNNTRLVDAHGHKEQAHLWDLWTPEWRRITALLWMTWAGEGLVYYGTIMTVTLIFSDSGEETTGPQDSENGQYSFDYGAIFTSSSSELAGTTIAIFLIDRAGRIRTQTSFYCMGGIFVFVLCLLDSNNNAPRWPKVLAAFLARLAFMAATCTTWVTTAEILTTDVRTTGHSFANAMGRIGGSLSPYLVSKETPLSVIGTVLLLCSLFTALNTSRLPETKGQSMGAVSPPVRLETELATRVNPEGHTYDVI